MLNRIAVYYKKDGFVVLVGTIHKSFIAVPVCHFPIVLFYQSMEKDIDTDMDTEHRHISWPSSFLEFGLLLKLISSGKLANCLSTATHTADSMLFKISSGSRLNAKIINYKF